MINPQQFAMNLLKNNPGIANQPNAADMIQAIQNNDNARGEQLANNILSSMGMTKEQALQLAAKRFGF